MIKLKEGQVWSTLNGAYDLEIIRIDTLKVDYKVTNNGSIRPGSTYTTLIDNLQDSFKKVPYNLKILATMKNIIKKSLTD